VRVSHRDTVEDMLRKGRDLERVVLARAVRWHLENRVLVYQNKTVVFNETLPPRLLRSLVFVTGT
jgi:formyltetrahydrofolate deformylase